VGISHTDSLRVLCDKQVLKTLRVGCPLKNRLRGCAANATLLFVTLTILTIGAEMATRMLADVEIPLLTPHPVVGRTLLPDFSGAVYNKESERDVQITTNGDGFRGVDRPLVPEDGVRRIAVLGDSFIAALACEDDETAVVELERLLNESRPEVRWEVMNFGVSGSSTAQELVLYREMVADYSPDLVIVAFFVGNDYQDNSEPLSNSQRIYLRLNESGELVTHAPSQQRKRGSVWLNRHSRFYVWQKEATRMFRISGPAAQVYRTDPDPVLDEAWHLTSRILETFAEEVRDDGSQFLLALLPTGEQIYDDMWRERVEAADDVAGTTLRRDYPDEKLTGIAANVGFRAISMTDDFRAAASVSGRSATETAPDELLFFRGYGHFTPRGNALAARVIHEYLTAGNGRRLLEAVLRVDPRPG